MCLFFISVQFADGTNEELEVKSGWLFIYHFFLDLFICSLPYYKKIISRYRIVR